MFCSKCGASLRPEFHSCPACGASVLTGSISPSSAGKESSEDSGYEDTPYMEFGPIVEPVSPPRRADTPVQAQPVALAPFVKVSQPGIQARPVQSAAPPIKSQQHGGRVTWIIAISTFLILLIITVGGLTYYATLAHPAALSAHATAVAQTFLTAQANTTSPQSIYTYATSGKPVIHDPLSDEATSVWYQQTGPQVGCVFQNGAYHIFATRQYSGTVCSASMSFTNFAFQIQMTILQGRYGGIAFRMVSRASRWYNLVVSQDGYYSFQLFNDTSGVKALAPDSTP